MKFRTGSLDRIWGGFQCSFTQKTTKWLQYISLQNCPGRFPPIRRALRCPPLRANRSRFRSEFLHQSAGGSTPRARALHGLGQLFRKSAPCALRTDRRKGGHAIGQHRRAAESYREQLLQGRARKRRYSRYKCTDPRRLNKALARSTQELLATAPHI